MQQLKKTLKAGLHTLALPLKEPTPIEQLFPKELAGATIEKLDSNGKWTKKETVKFLDKRSFSLSETYAVLLPFDTVRLELKRDMTIEWSVNFLSHSGLEVMEKEFELGFDFEEALYLAQLSVLVYQDEERIKESIEHYYNFDEFNFYSKYSHKTLFKKRFLKIMHIWFRSRRSIIDLQFMQLFKVNPQTDEKRVTLIFRGSQETQDWMTNFRLKKENYLKRGKIHQGFKHVMKLFINTVKKEKKLHEKVPEILQSKTKVVLAGHSLGGALAILVGCYLIEQGVDKEKIEVYTFGSPPIGDKEFCDYYEDKLYVHRLVNEHDIVARLDKITTFCHVGKEYLLSSNHGEIHSGEGYIDNIIDSMGTT